jgi:hypothetical protein
MALARRQSYGCLSYWCPGPESNRYVSFETRDFKSSSPLPIALRHQGFAISYRVLTWQSMTLCVHAFPCDGHDLGMKDHQWLSLPLDRISGGGCFSAQFIPNTKQRADVSKLPRPGARKTQSTAEIRATGCYSMQRYTPTSAFISESLLEKIERGERRCTASVAEELWRAMWRIKQAQQYAIPSGVELLFRLEEGDTVGVTTMREKLVGSR